MADSHLLYGYGGQWWACDSGEGRVRGWWWGGGGRRGGRGAAQLWRLVAAVGALRHTVTRVVHRDALAAVPALELVAAAPPCFKHQAYCELIAIFFSYFPSFAYFY